MNLHSNPKPFSITPNFCQKALDTPSPSPSPSPSPLQCFRWLLQVWISRKLLYDSKFRSRLGRSTVLRLECSHLTEQLAKRI